MKQLDDTFKNLDKKNTPESEGFFKKWKNFGTTLEIRI